MKTIELDGITLMGVAVENNEVVRIAIPRSEEKKIKNLNATCHRLYGKLFEVSSIVYDIRILRIFGRYTDEPTAYFQEG